jgi:glycosyl-4,4'-diaponeurosporenoate acyltransferase
MPPLKFPAAVIVSLNFILWFLIHFSAGYLGAKLPARLFAQDSGIFRTRSWEKEGFIYQSLFRIKQWKPHLPDWGNAFGQNASKQRVASTDPSYLERFILETRRAEWTHWMQIFPVPVFFLFNDWRVGIFMVLYALSVNLPCMMTQRFNRPRLQRILANKKIRG